LFSRISRFCLGVNLFAKAIPSCYTGGGVFYCAAFKRLFLCLFAFSVFPQGFRCLTSSSGRLSLCTVSPPLTDLRRWFLVPGNWALHMEPIIAAEVYPEIWAVAVPGRLDLHREMSLRILILTEVGPEERLEGLLIAGAEFRESLHGFRLEVLGHSLTSLLFGINPYEPTELQ
jgi:hypothetical protein